MENYITKTDIVRYHSLAELKLCNQKYEYVVVQSRVKKVTLIENKKRMTIQQDN